jgi:hypothetical protein
VKYIGLILAFAFGLLACSQLPSTRVFGWTSISPGGQTSCAFGDPYQFFVRRGDPERLVIDFQGGGACWNGESCQKAARNLTYLSEVNPFVVSVGNASGIYDLDTVQNPLLEWSQIHVPYCTGDLHAGSRDVVYSQGQRFTIRHRGAINTKAVLDWVYKHYPNPKQVFVTGCSAGGYASLIWSPMIMRHYSSSFVAQFSDGAVGGIGEAVYRQGVGRWGIEAASPDIPEARALFLNPSQIRLPKLYQIYAKAFPNNSFAQFNTQFDQVQTAYYVYSQYGKIQLNEFGGFAVTPAQQQEWSRIRAQNLELLRDLPNFYALNLLGANDTPIGESQLHCILPTDRLLSQKIGTVKTVDWLSTLINAGQPGWVSGEAR